MAVGSSVRFFGLCAGIYVCYLFYSMVQESIVTRKWGEEGESFNVTLFLLQLQCLVNGCVALFMWKLRGGGPKSSELSTYAISAGTYIGAMAFSNLALLYIDYPTQVLGKSCKPLAVLLVTAVVFRQLEGYSIHKLGMVIFICTGIGVFMWEKASARANPDADPVSPIGYALVLGSLVMDGVCAGTQKILVRNRHAKQANKTPKSGLPLMFYNNFWSVMYLTVWGLLSGDMFKGIDFCYRHPFAIVLFGGFGFASAIGQLFIYAMIAHYGPLTLSLVTTTRKFFTILGSVLLYGHAVSGLQWFGVALVFLGLLWEDFVVVSLRRTPATDEGKPHDE